MAATIHDERAASSVSGEARNTEIEGLRAIAALAVLVTHVSLNSIGNRGALGGILARLDVGVAVFFVISGFLLHRPFARAFLRGDARPDTRAYLRRRLIRIVPLYWVVVFASFLFQPARGDVMPTVGFSPAPQGTTEVPIGDLLGFLSFTHVYRSDTVAGPFPQAWTLAVEMAFYLLLPLLAWGLGRIARPTRAGRVRQQHLLLLGLVAIATAFRLAMVVLHGGFDGDAATSVVAAKAWLPNHLDLFAIGMAFAVWSVERADRGPGEGIGRRLESLMARPGAAEASWAVAAGFLVLAGYGLGLSRTDLNYGPAGEFLRHGAYAAIAASLALPAIFGRGGGGPVRALLRCAPMQFLGRISYGIYVWQILVIGRWVSAPAYEPGTIPGPARHPGAQFQVPFASTLAWTLIVTIILATASWYLVEKPWLRFRTRKLGTFVGGLWAIVVASFIGRIWAFSTVTRNIPGNGDPFFYHAQANMLADGVGFGEPIQWLTEGRFVASAIHPPIFTLWLTPASLIGARGFVAHKTMAAIAGTLVVVIAALLARRLAGPRAGLIAAVAVALYPNLWVIDGTLWPEGLYTATVGFALLMAFAWRDDPTLRRAAAVGAAAGIAILTRGEALLLLPLLCLPLALSGRLPAGARVKHLMAMGIAAGLLVAPWTIRNFLTYDSFVPVSTNSQEVLYYANCEDSYHGTFVGYWSFMCQERERADRVARGLPADPPGNEAERAAAWGDMGIEYAKANRDRLPAVMAARVARMWDIRYGDANAQVIVLEGRPHDIAKAGLWTYRAIAIPGLVGLWILRRRGERPWPLVAMIGVITVTAIYAYGHVRFRTVGDLVLLIGFAVTVDAIWRRLRPPPGAAEERRSGRAAASGADDEGNATADDGGLDTVGTTWTS